jgi:hypothetical protein
MAWFGEVRSGEVRFGLAWFGEVRSGEVRFGLVRASMKQMIPPSTTSQ